MKSKKKTPLTNEQVLAHFQNNFSLALNAINLAHEYVKSGKEFQLRSILDDASKREARHEEDSEES